jgi:ArsR family transcriptional regulator
VPTPAPPLDLAEAQQRAARLKALADPQRLRILSLLAAQPRQEPLCVCDIEAAFDLSQPTISHHLRVLRQAGLVDLTRRGLWHYYRLRPEGLAEIRDALAALLPGR